MLYDLVIKNRSYRRFNAKRRISTDEIAKMLECARCSASAGNLQRIRYATFNEKEQCDAIVKSLGFAAYLKDWKGPKDSEQPAAYIILLTEKDPDINLSIDIGIAAQSILLSATEMGLGGCMLRNFSSEEIKNLVGKSDYAPCLVIALGEPDEKAYITNVKNGDIKYYRDENDFHVVPKLSLEDLIIN